MMSSESYATPCTAAAIKILLHVALLLAMAQTAVNHVAPSPVMTQTATANPCHHQGQLLHQTMVLQLRKQKINLSLNVCSLYLLNVFVVCPCVLSHISIMYCNNMYDIICNNYYVSTTSK